ncbi:LPS-assembly lipoprotein LptE [Legionella sp. CNM-4043-24]|uniref:LPS-assembly lipoprotein LptE n=1 Tax=Legionella sp. CNM-4043-24 TaxID=3421646 RepID=UPI00403B1286
MFKRAIWRYFIVATIALLLSSCGFRLRGMADIPPWLNNIAIVVQNGHKDLVPLLKEQLRAYKIRINPDPARADYILIIEQDSLQQKITSVSASTTPRQYQLLYSVVYSLVKRKAAPIVSSRLIAVTRQLTVNNNRILGSDSEESMITRDMREDAVMQIISRLGR